MAQVGNARASSCTWLDKDIATDNVHKRDINKITIQYSDTGNCVQINIIYNKTVCIWVTSFFPVTPMKIKQYATFS